MGLYRKENGNLVEKSGNVDYSEINAIKDSLTQKNLSSQVTNIKSGLEVYLYKVGNICEVYLFGTIQTTVDNEVVAKLPSNCKSFKATYFAMNEQISGNWYYILEDKIYVRYAGIMNKNGNITYIAQ